MMVRPGFERVRVRRVPTRGTRAGLGDAAPADQPPISASEQAAWYDVIGQFEQKANDFLAARADLAAQAPFIAAQPADIQAEYADLVARADSTQSNIQKVQAALADVKNALTGAWNYVTGVWDSFAATVVPDINAATGLSPYAGLQGLGSPFFPLIPIAIVAAAVAALAYFLNDYAQFSKKVQLLKQGMSPADVNKVLGSASITSTLGTLVWIAGGIVLLIYLPKLIGSYKALR
jgi:hypothetical protein